MASRLRTLFGIELTPRCKVLRTIYAELARVLDHYLSVGAAALDLGALTAFVYGFNEREIIYDLFEEACGARFTTSISRVGGLFRDIPPTWPAAVKANLPRIGDCIEELEKLLVSNRIFIERTKGIGVVSHDDAINWSLTGPAARASGVKRDLRKEPYLCFSPGWDETARRRCRSVPSPRW
jgi:NADH-quinone oxidoreductase subunit D